MADATPLPPGAPDTPSRPPAALRPAALWMGGWLLLMVVIAVAGREAMRELSVFQVLELRSLIGLLMLWPLLRASGGWAAVRTAQPGRHVVRNVVHYAAQYGWFAALLMIPMAQVVAIEFTMPIWAAVLAVTVLGERLNRWKVLAVALGLLGVLMIVRPGTGALNPGQLIALAAAVGFAVSVVMVKLITRTDAAIAVSFWMLVVQSVIGLLPALWLWQWPSPATWGWVLVVAFCGTYSHYCFARAMQYAEATVLVPMDFLRVPLSALAGWAVYAERVDLLTVLGMVTILAGNALNLRKSRG
jgi:drug/metabolite transporter (DMT)-like permease